MPEILKSKHYRMAEAIGFSAFVAIFSVDFYFRPNSANMSAPVKWFLGVAPNFFGGIGLTISIFIYRFQGFKKWGLSLHKKCFASAIISSIGLLVWEAIRSIGSFFFDPEDVIMSAVGSGLSLILLLLLVNANIRKGNFDL
jgi:zinc transporter ZupT